MSKQKKYHYIYKTTCQITGKFYVGMHSTDNLEDGYLGSGKILGYSRHKYGDENHTKEILFYCSSRNELKQKEREVVNEDLLKHPLNINLKYGGEGGWDHLNNGSAEHIERTRKCGAKGGQKIGSSNFRKITAEHRAKAVISRKMHGTFATLGMTGRRHSEETKLQMSESGRGEKNSQYGSCWVTNGIKPIKIKKEQLDEYLQMGYSRGRKFNSPVL